MWIETENRDDDGAPLTVGLKQPWMEEPVEFSANGKAQVPKEVGQRLVDENALISESGSDTASDADDAAAGGDDDAGDGEAQEQDQPVELQDAAED